MPLRGTLEIKGRLAYASQDPWIFSGTVRQNILCGLEYEPLRYQQVIQVTELEHDFGLFQNGDRAEVGEKGLSLSGGQKARISMARCLYVDADIYLLDDPLSAVDAHVGGKIFENAIQGFLSRKMCILVTHQLQYLKAVDKIIVLEKVNSHISCSLAKHLISIFLNQFRERFKDWETFMICIHLNC